MFKLVLVLGIFSSLFDNIEINHEYLDNQISITINNIETEYNEYQDYLKKEEERKKKEYERLHTFNGESSEKIAKKLDKFLHSTLKGKGKFITEYSIKVGLDPYLAAGVMLQETGCYWTCSYLTRVCNNVGGQKGKPSCNGGSYRKFKTIEEGIKFTINKLNSYYQKGYKTPYQINPFYATDKKWGQRVQNYINKLKKA